MDKFIEITSHPLTLWIISRAFQILDNFILPLVLLYVCLVHTIQKIDALHKPDPEKLHASETYRFIFKCYGDQIVTKYSYLAKKNYGNAFH